MSYYDDFIEPYIGLYDDEYEDEHYNDIHYKELFELYQLRKLHWITKAEEEVLIQDMTDSHLVNTIFWIEKQKEISTALSKMRDILQLEKFNRNLF